MRWLALLTLLMLSGATALNGCSTAEIYAIALSTHNPTERHERMARWLQAVGARCNEEQLVVIWNNLPNWAGTSDSIELRREIIALYEKLAAREKK
jgi:hypothetical protein